MTKLSSLHKQLYVIEIQINIYGARKEQIATFSHKNRKNEVNYILKKKSKLQNKLLKFGIVWILHPEV